MDVDLAVLLFVALVAFLQLEIRPALVSNSLTNPTASAALHRPPPAGVQRPPVELAADYPAARPTDWTRR